MEADENLVTARSLAVPLGELVEESKRNRERRSWVKAMLLRTGS